MASFNEVSIGDVSKVYSTHLGLRGRNLRYCVACGLLESTSFTGAVRGTSVAYNARPVTETFLLATDQRAMVLAIC
jgi:hypothetical protein